MQDRTDDPLRSGKRADKTSRFSLSRYALSRGLVSRARNGNVGVRIVAARLPKALLPKTVAPSRYSERSSLHDVRYHASRRSTHDCSRVHCAMKSEFVFSSDEIPRSSVSPRGAKAGSPTEAALAAKVGGARRDRTDDLLLAKQALSQLSYGPCWKACRRRPPSLKLRRATFAERRLARQPKRRWPRRLVGLGRFELPTSRLSSARSNQLSYKP